MSARGAVAQQQGVDEQMLEKVDHYEDSDLAPEQRAALRLADAYLVAPGAISDSVRVEVSAHLTPAQVVEVVLKLTGFSSDKALVALGIDFDEVQTFTMG
jgi:alkylhydroperoxidase family enzyme